MRQLHKLGQVKTGMFLLFLFSQIHLLIAQTTLSGTITDENSEPLIGVTVYLEGTSSGTRTDLEGKYSFSSLLSGEKQMIVSYVGYTNIVETVALDGNPIIKNFSLAPDVLGLSEVVITGNANPKSRLESSIAISTVNRDRIQNSGARSTAELYKMIPGLFVNASGGEGNANIEIRGNPSNGGGKFVQVQEDGLPVVPFSDLMFGNVDMFTRLDFTTQRVETIRGGSASVFGSNSGGGIINNISKTGVIEGGSVGMEVGLDFAHLRTDFEYGAHLGKDIRFHVGGFYRNNEGVRSPGYSANKGGQIKFNITKEFDNGYVRLYFKHLNDNTIPYIPIPLAREGEPNSNEVKLGSLPGFSGTHGTFHSVDLLRFKAQSPSGGFVEESLEGGMEPKATSWGAEVFFDLGSGWSLKNKLRLSVIDQEFNGIFSFSGSPQSASEFAASKGVTDFSYSYTSGLNAGQPLSRNQLDNLNGNGLVVEYGYWNVDLPMEYTANEITFNKNFEESGANLTLGAFFHQFDLESEWWWHNFLADVSDNTRRLDLVDNASGESLTVNGFSQYGTLYKSYKGESRVYAPFVNYEIAVNENLNIDAGVRLDIGRITGQTNVGVGAAFDYDVNNDGVISQAETGVLHNDGRFIPIDASYENFSYSIGLNYKFSENFATFARHSQGARFNFDRAFAFNAVANRESGLSEFEEDGERIIQYELGVKYKSPTAGFFITGFHTRYPDDVFQELIFDSNGNSINLTSRGLIQVTGVEFEAKVVFGNIDLDFNGTFFSRTYGDRIVQSPDGTALDLSGEKTPGVNSFFTFTPQYRSDNGKFTFGTSLIYRGQLDNGDFDDTFFPAYMSVNPFIGLNIGENVSIGINGSNVFNVIGIDEGNPRSIVSPVGQNVTFARPLLGRSIISRVVYSF
ncbi:MAG: TonB-dependent receptor [Bacteroidota bacterium]